MGNQPKQNSAETDVSIDVVVWSSGVIAITINLALPIAYGAFGFDPLMAIVLTVFGLPVVAFIANLIFARRHIRYGAGAIGAKVWRSLLLTVGVTIVGILIGAIVCLIARGYDLESCVDSCSHYTVLDGAMFSLYWSQTYLLGAYIGILLGASRAKYDQKHGKPQSPQGTVAPS